MALRRFFGTDGIRGEFGCSPLTPKEMWAIGYAIACYLSDSTKSHPRVILGRDTRHSGDTIVRALCGGLKKRGVSIDYVGIAPTPAISLLTQKRKADLGMMVSASHNPYQYNGIKFFNAAGEKLSDGEEEALETAISRVLESSKTLGYSQEAPPHVSPLSEYTDFLCASVADLKGVKVVIDCAHGALSEIAGPVFRKCGAQVLYEIGITPDGKNINESVGSVYPETLAKVVKEWGADLGLAFDGDGDRVMVADASGAIYDGDQILACLSKRYGQDGVVGTVMSNLGLENFFLSHHIPFVRAQVGDRYIAQHLKTLDWKLGGEPCGHVLLNHFLPTGDGLLAGVLVADVIATEGNPFPLFASVPSILKNVIIKNKVALDCPELAAYIQGMNQHMQGQGRFLVRSSGTEPVLRVLVEGECEALIHKVACDAVAHLTKTYGIHRHST